MHNISQLFFLFFLSLGNLNVSVTSTKGFLNPTGTYKFDEKTVKRNGEVYGHFGEIRVKLIDSSKVAMCFYICKGAPSYNSGSFVDTLEYTNGKIVYIPEVDSTCKMTFQFKKHGIDVTQIQGNLNIGCGFGHGVFADGYFKRISRKEPEIVHLLDEQTVIN